MALSYENEYATEAVVIAFTKLEDARVKMVAAQEAVKEVVLMYGVLFEAMHAMRRDLADFRRGLPDASGE